MVMPRYFTSSIQEIGVELIRREIQGLTRFLEIIRRELFVGLMARPGWVDGYLFTYLFVYLSLS